MMANFVFQGVKPECVQGRLLNTILDRDGAKLIIIEFFQCNKSSLLLCKENFSQSYTICLPDELTAERVVGKPLCIGCHGNFFLFQFITNTCRFIRFFIVNVDKGILQIFEDNMRYLLRDFVSVGPLLSHISTDTQHILLRLNRHVIASRKWSKLLMVKKERSDHPDNLLFKFKGTEQAPILDKLFQCMTFDKFNSDNIITALVDEFCSKCKFVIYNIETKREILQKVHRLGSRSVTIATSDSEDTDSDGEDSYFLLQESSLILTRDGNTLILCCILTDNKQKTFVKLFVYDAKSISFRCSHETVLPQLIFPVHKSLSLVWILTTCDREIQLWRMQRGHSETDKLYHYKLPNSTNLKSLCRSTILQHIKIPSINKLPLPDILQKYIRFQC